MGDGSSGKFRWELLVGWAGIGITIAILLWGGGKFQSKVEASFGEIKDVTKTTKSNTESLEGKIDELSNRIAGTGLWDDSEEYLRTRTAVERSIDQLAESEADLGVWLDRNKKRLEGSDEWKEANAILLRLRVTRCTLAKGTFNANSSQCTGVRGWR